MQPLRPQSFRLSIIIPTRNRVKILAQLLESIAALDGVGELQPEVIVANNGSEDDTYAYVNSARNTFPTEIRILNIGQPGKSVAANEAVKAASGDFLAFLDDDVVVDKNWLNAVADFFRRNEYRVGQGVIRLRPPESRDPDVLRLVERYRTIPRLEHARIVRPLRSLNGANFFVARDVFERVGGFDERLGPGASGTSEDVDFARRLNGAGIAIGYVPEAIVYHRVDVNRLTESYFRQSHRRQGASRFLIRQQSSTAIFLDLVRTVIQFGYYSLIRSERKRYRSKGRIYHYLGMLEAKQNHKDQRQAVTTESVMDASSPHP
jgi:GT2 family glycosyltransferase